MTVTKISTKNFDWSTNYREVFIIIRDLSSLRKQKLLLFQYLKK
jgi:hypothetical protein